MILVVPVTFWPVSISLALTCSLFDLFVSFYGSLAHLHNPSLFFILFQDDVYYSDKQWAEIDGIKTEEVNRLELEFLFRIGFSLHLQREEYDRYTEELHLRVLPWHISEASSLAASSEAGTFVPSSLASWLLY